MFTSRDFLSVEYNVLSKNLLGTSANQKRHYLTSYNKCICNVRKMLPYNWEPTIDPYYLNEDVTYKWLLQTVLISGTGTLSIHEAII